MRTRREFVRDVALVTVGGVALASCRGKGKPVPTGDAPLIVVPDGLRALDADQYRLVAALSERILPRDQDPGAIDLGVPVYIDHALADGDPPSWREPFLSGLALFDQEALAALNRRFYTANTAQQDQQIFSWQLEGDAQKKAFLGMVLLYTLEGAFGDPSHGGNRAMDGWKMVGFAGDDACAPRHS